MGTGKIFPASFFLSSFLFVEAAAGEFQTAVSVSTGLSPRGIAVGDVYGTGVQDLVLADFGSSTFIGKSTPSSVLNQGNFGLEIFSPSPRGLLLKDTITTGASPRGLFLLDVDGSGRSSIFGTSYDANLLQVFGFSKGKFRKTAEAPTLKMPVGVVAGAIRPGGMFFVATANFGSDSISLFPVKNGFLGKRVDIGVDSGPTQVALGNLSGTGNNDIAVVCLTAHKVDILSIGNDNKSEDLAKYSISQTITLNGGGSPSDIKVKALDKGGLADIVVSDFSNNSIQIFLQQANGSFLAQTPLPTSGSHPNGLTVDDLYGDGKNEIVVANRDSDSIDIFQPMGGTFHLTQTLKSSDESNSALGPVEVAVLDTTGSGSKDLVVSHMRSNSLKVMKQKVSSPPSTPTMPPLGAMRTGFMANTTFCFPNPSRDGRITFSFSLDVPAQAFIQIFDVGGERVWSQTVPAGQTHSGTNQVFWTGTNLEGENLASGLYIYTITVGNETVQKQLTLVR